LLPFLKPLTRRRHLREFKGKTIGVDAMCWMHKGAYACSQELVVGKDTDKFVYFFLRMVELLRYHEIKPVIVFDGAKMPAKAKEDARRQEIREASRKEALELMERRGHGEYVDEVAIARKCEGAIKVTSKMISRLQGALLELSIHFLVAPYEADAQLAYMCRIGWVHAVISDDSDLLAYGCPNTIFKLDKYGEGENICLPCLQPVGEQAGVADASDQDEEQEHAKGEEQEGAKPAEIEDAASVGDGGAAEPSQQRRGRRRVGSRGRARGKGRGRGDAGDAEQAPKKPLLEEERAVQEKSKEVRNLRKQLEKDGIPEEEVEVRLGPLNAELFQLRKARTAALAPALATARAAARTRAGEAHERQLACMARWSPEKFAEFCVICGTDYKEPNVHIKGLGIKTAYALMCKYRDAIRMFHWMLREPKWKPHFPCEAAEFEDRFRSILAVFWHHIVFDPRRGHCVSIANAFPDVNRELPGIDLTSVCGTPIAKEHAKRAVKGEIDPRTHMERIREPLTPAERHTLDRIIQQKRFDQGQVEAEHRRKVEAQEIANAIAEKAAAASAANQKLPAAQGGGRDGGGNAGPAHGGAAPGAPGDPPADAPEEDQDDDEPAPKPMCLLQGDIDAIMAVKDGLREGDGADGGSDAAVAGAARPGESATPPRQAALPAAADTPPPVATPSQRGNPFARVNPFSRKRPLVEAAGASAEVAPASTPRPVLEKRQRVLPPGVLAALGRTPTPSGASAGRRANDAADAAKSPGTGGPGPKIVAAELHPRGGFAAKFAAESALMQKGIYAYEKDQDRGKLTSFFGKSQTSEATRKPGVANVFKRKEDASHERGEDPRHGTEADPSSTHVGENLLSLRSSKRASALFKRFW